MALCCALPPSPAIAVEPAPVATRSKPALRAAQAELFRQMQADPQNLDLMFDYAGISARLEDFETAISTLERMLIFDASLRRVRLELGALYFNIGSYATSERYFRSAVKDGGIPAPVQLRVDAYMREIARRTARHRFRGNIEAGIVYDSNANLGPDNADVLLFGQNATLDPDSLGEEDFGGRLAVNLRHDYDLGGPGTDYWRSDAQFFGRRFKDESDGNVESLRLRTGPNLALDDTLYGPKLRPYGEFSFARSGGDNFFIGGALGGQYSQSLSDTFSLFGDLRVEYRDYYKPRDDEDGAILGVTAGAAYAPTRDTVFTAAINANTDRADADYEANTEIALRLGAIHDYDPGLSFVTKKWRLQGFASLGYRDFDAANPAVSPDETRSETELRAGIEHTFFLSDGFYTSLGASYLQRDSSLPNFDLDNVGVSAVVGYEF